MKSYHRTDLEEIHSRFNQVRPVVSHIEGHLPNKSPTLKNIGEGLKRPPKNLWKSYLFVKYEKNKNFSLLSAPIPIKPLPEGKKLLRSLIAPIIKEGKCSE